MKLLLEKGADTSLKVLRNTDRASVITQLVQDPDNFTALELAEVAGHEDIVKLLSNASSK